MSDETKKPRREKRAESERALDEAIEESFPASDPPATTPTRAGAPERSRAPAGFRHRPARPGPGAD